MIKKSMSLCMQHAVRGVYLLPRFFGVLIFESCALRVLDCSPVVSLSRRKVLPCRILRSRLGLLSKISEHSARWIHFLLTDFQRHLKNWSNERLRLHQVPMASAFHCSCNHRQRSLLNLIPTDLRSRRIQLRRTLFFCAVTTCNSQRSATTPLFDRAQDDFAQAKRRRPPPRQSHTCYPIAG